MKGKVGSGVLPKCRKISSQKLICGLPPGHDCDHRAFGLPDEKTGTRRVLETWSRSNRDDSVRL